MHLTECRSSVGLIIMRTKTRMLPNFFHQLITARLLGVCSLLIGLIFSFVIQAQDLSHDLRWLIDNANEDRMANFDIENRSYTSNDPEFQAWIDRAMEAGQWIEGELLFGSVKSPKEWRESFSHLSKQERQQAAILRFKTEQEIA